MRRIRGIIIPSDWDADGKITAIRISAFGEDDFLLIGPLVPELMEIMRIPIELQGEIITTAQPLMLNVKTYRKIRPPSLKPHVSAATNRSKEHLAPR